MTITYINLTPHKLDIYDRKMDAGAAMILEPSGTVARVVTNRQLVDGSGPFPIFRTVYGDVTGLPEPKEGVRYIVSGMVAARVPERTDVFKPGSLIRDAKGRPVGCEGLDMA